MLKLLRSNFSRLWRDRIFWLCMGAMLIYVFLYMLNGCRQAVKDLSEYGYSLEQYYFHVALSIGLFCSVCSSMFFGTEYHDGTLRNKVIVGHTREGIYLASLLTTFLATLAILSVWLVGALVAVPVLGFWKMSAGKLLCYLLVGLMFILSFSAICTVINMLSSNKANTFLISILLFIGLLLLASVVYNGLCQPEMISGVQITQNGLEMTEGTPNPNYVTGWKRELYDFIVDFLPTGQGIRMWQLEVANPLRMVASSLFLTIVTTAGGMFAFHKKDIR